MAVKQLQEGIYQISVEKPEAFNALSSEIIAELILEFGIACGDSSTRVVIFRGAEVPGKYKAPMAGADLTGLVDIENWQPISAVSARQHMEEGLQAIGKIRQKCRREGEAGWVLVLGIVDGPCLAGGIEFMFGLSHLVLVTPRSVFGMREILLGGMGGWGGPQILRERLGSPLWVNEMLLGLGGQKAGDISAETALARGLVNRLVPEEEIEATALELAQRVVNLDPLAVTFNLEVAEYDPGANCTPLATDRMVELMQGSAWVQGVRKFLEKGKK